MVVKALYLPLILVMDFQVTHAQAIYPQTSTIRWTNGPPTNAGNSWKGKEAKALPLLTGRPKQGPIPLCLTWGVTIQPRCIHAVYGGTNMNGRCLLGSHGSRYL